MRTGGKCTAAPPDHHTWYESASGQERRFGPASTDRQSPAPPKSGHSRAEVPRSAKRPCGLAIRRQSRRNLNAARNALRVLAVHPRGIFPYRIRCRSAFPYISQDRISLARASPKYEVISRAHVTVSALYDKLTQETIVGREELYCSSEPPLHLRIVRVRQHCPEIRVAVDDCIPRRRPARVRLNCLFNRLRLSDDDAQR